MDSTYAEVGTEVILRQGSGFVRDMEPYLNRKAIITRVFYSTSNFVKVDVDDSSFLWCVNAMILASDEPLLRK